MNLNKYVGKKIHNDLGEYIDAGEGDSYEGRDSELERYAHYLVYLCDDEFAERIGCDSFSLNIYVDESDIIQGVAKLAHQHFHNDDGYDMKIEMFSMMLENEAEEIMQHMVGSGKA